jgi:chaperonin GroEL
MAHKQVLFRSDASEKILRGVNALADAVRVTLGPKSKCVLIERKYGAPLVCNDGVTIAKEMSLADPAENMGAQMIRQAAERTRDAVGDGTSTATILAQAIFTDGVRNVVAGASAIDLTRAGSRRARGRGKPPAPVAAREEPARESAGRDDLCAQRCGDRRADRGCNGEGR